jgi:hypothetical protein
MRGAPAVFCSRAVKATVKATVRARARQIGADKDREKVYSC